jgi:hypothetical protein
VNPVGDEGAQHADMRKPARGPAAQRETDAQALARLV